MKITAGLGSVDDYIPYVQAGADECFAGFVPEFWQKEWGNIPLNRREVNCVNVNIGPETELQILSELVKKYHIPVAVTLNGLNFLPEQFPYIAKTIELCRSYGFNSFIISDMGLLLYLYEQGLSEKIDIHVSGELGEINSLLCSELVRLGMNRLIFHRKVSIKNMAALSGDKGIQYEAFALNEMCHFHGGYCNSLHSDELIPMCQMPYTFGGRKEKTSVRKDVAGAGGCGLCALWRMQKAGISYLKIVGRGAHSENMVRDILAVKKAINILESSESEAEYIFKIKNSIFPEGCSENCYYREDGND